MDRRATGGPFVSASAALAQNAAQDECDVRGPLREPSHEVRIPLAAIGHVDAYAPTAPQQALLEIAANSVKHLELKPIASDALLARDADRPSQDRLVVGCQGWVRPGAEEALHERDVAGIDVRLRAERHRLRFLVRALAQPDPGSLLDEALDVGGATSESRLDDDPARWVCRPS